MEVFLFHNNPRNLDLSYKTEPRNLDPSCKTDLDLSYKMGLGSGKVQEMKNLTAELQATD